MSEHNPAVVAHALEGVLYELRKGGVILQTSIEDTSREQRRADETAQRTRQLAAVVAETAQDDDRRVREIESLADQAVAAAHGAVARCNQAQNNAASCLHEADSALSHWENQLAAARDWLQRARAALAAAQARLAQCERQRDIASAAYSNCMSYRGPNGEMPNCSAESAALSRAQNAVDIARAAVNAAQAEVNRAVARVAACEKAVALAHQAVSVAHQAGTQAHSAMNCAQGAMTRASEARQLATESRGASDREMAASDSMNASAQSAVTHVGEAEAQLRLAESAAGQVAQSTDLGRRQLEDAIEALQRLNQPEPLP